MKYLFIVFSILLSSIAFAQVQPSVVECLSDQAVSAREFVPAKTISQMKVIRINYHFMLKSDGTGNFNETTDGLGNPYSGYDFARQLTNWMYWQCLSNIQMNIPPNSTVPIIAKNFYFVTDAVYFYRADTTYNFGSINITNPGVALDGDSVLNVFLTFHNVSNPNIGGHASDITEFSKNKVVENRMFWQHYANFLSAGDPIDWYYFWGPGATTKHELCHLLGLSHTVKYNWATPCGTGCTGLLPTGASAPINTACDDGCSDTPTAWEITALNNCSKHPDCTFGHGSEAYCSNNVMDYAGDNALTPCQIGRIHSFLEGGMRSYITCAAVNTDKTYCDLGYPRVSYFGRNISVGTCGTLANITSKEQLAAYYSGEVILNNFEIASDATFEIVYQATCGF
jgi:hypothetical protein